MPSCGARRCTRLERGALVDRGANKHFTSSSTGRVKLRRGKVPYSQKGKILHSLILSKYFFFSQFCPYLFLSRSFLLIFILSSF